MGSTEENHPLRENVVLERRREPVEYSLEGENRPTVCPFSRKETFTRCYSPYKSVFERAARPCIPRE